MELINGNVKVEWVALGEGLSGDYDPKDPEDVELLRFDICKLNPDSQAFECVDNGSYCTQMPSDTPIIYLGKALVVIMDEVYDKVESGISIKRIGERFSWLCPEDFENEEATLLLYRVG